MKDAQIHRQRERERGPWEVVGGLARVNGGLRTGVSGPTNGSLAARFHSPLRLLPAPVITNKSRPLNK